MARVVSVKMKKDANGEILTMNPDTSDKNILVTSTGQTLDVFVGGQTLKNKQVELNTEKLKTIEEGAEKNQNAISKIMVDKNSWSANSTKGCIEFIPGDNIAISLNGNQITITSLDDSKNEISELKQRIDMLESIINDLKAIINNPDGYTMDMRRSFAESINIENIEKTGPEINDVAMELPNATVEGSDITIISEEEGEIL